MSHPQQRAFIREVAALLHPVGPLLEIGSLDVNGTLRDLIDVDDWTGVDLEAGPGVDVVASGHDFGADESFATVVSSECLEHDPGWDLTLRNAVRVLRPGGLLLLTCATRGRHEHGTARTSPDFSPGTTAVGWDHYRNLGAADVLGVLGDDVVVDLCAVNHESFDLYVVAHKRPAPAVPSLRHLARRLRLDGLRPSRVSDRALLALWRAERMDEVPLWAGLAAHPVRVARWAAGVAFRR
ncbi:MAG TPA: class I SAM-dependent methyltransferase [Acidimicrobiales bacterium]|nr:class I SAM-dependent methyltransferase [Acidimicrobiales bacterium]